MKNHDVLHFLSEESAGILHFGGARMALLEVKDGFWSICRQMEALIGSRMTNSVIQQAGANGGAAFATSFGNARDVPAQERLFESCLQAYQTAGFGKFRISESQWPIGRVIIHAQDTVEAWMTREHGNQVTGPVCAYTSGVLVGFVNAISNRQDVICVQHRCQATGSDLCEFELLPIAEAGDQQVVAFTRDPKLGREINLLEMLFDRMPMGIAVIDLNFELVRTNPTWAAFIEQYTPSRASQVLPGANIFDLEPGTEETLVPLFNEVFCGKTVHLDAVRIESGGIESFWDIVLTPLFEGDQVVGLLNVSIDATERIQSERRLKETLTRLENSESMLRSVIENAQRFGVYRIGVDPDNLLSAKVLLVSPSIGEMLGIDDLSKFDDWFTNLHPEDLPRVLEANNRSLKEGIPYNQPTRCFNKQQNRWRWVHTISDPGFDAQGNLTHFDGIVIDLTEQKEAELALREINATLEQRVDERTRDVERRHQIAQSLRDIIRMINSNVPLESFLDETVKLATLHMDAAACTLHRFDFEKRIVTHLASYNMPVELIKGSARPFSELRASGAADYLKAISQRQATYGNYPPYPERVETIERDPSIPENIKRQRLAIRMAFAGSLSVPLLVQDKVYGGMVFYYVEPQDFTDEQIQLAMTFAEQVSLAIENTRLKKQAEQTAITSERNRLARDLHDAVSQTLFSTSLIADVLPRLWELNPQTAKQKLDELRLLTRGALSEMRTLLFELRPSALAEMELGELLRHLTSAFTGRARIPVELTLIGQADLPAEVKEVFYRVVQESLNNINKHTEATNVSVRLETTETNTVMQIYDNGCGFDVLSVSPENLGLKIMRERAESIKAELKVESVMGTGTTIYIIWRAEKECL